MKRYVAVVLFAAAVCASDSAGAQYVYWHYTSVQKANCQNGQCSSAPPVKKEAAEPSTEELLRRRVDELEVKLAEFAAREEDNIKPSTIQPVPDDALVESLKNAEPSDASFGEKEGISAEEKLVFPDPEQIKSEPIGVMSNSGRWTMCASIEECNRVDRIMEEMSDEFGFSLDALEKTWVKFPVCFVGAKGYAGCTYWNGSAVDRINIVSAYDDSTDRVLRHELIHAALFYLTKNDTSLFIHEATTQQAEPGVRDAYVRKMKNALASDRPELTSWVDKNAYDGGLKLYTFGYGVSEYLVSLGGKEWYWGFVMDYGRKGFSTAIREWYGLSCEEFSDNLERFYLVHNADRSSLHSLVKERSL